MEIKMHILFVEWKSLCQYDIIMEFQRRGWQVDMYSFPREQENTRLNTKLAEELITAMAGKNYDFVFSFNYFPVISIACNACRIKYVSWTFDSPFVQLYSNTITFPYNYVFIFDKGTCQQFWDKGISTVYYLPMAAPVKRYDIYRDKKIDGFDAQISFIGSTYSEKKNRMCDKLSGISPYTKGYLESIMQAQKLIYGKFILEELLNPVIMQDLLKACPIVQNQDGFERLEWVYAHYFLARRVTALERKEVLELLSDKFDVNLYTYEETPDLPKVHNRGTAEVLQEAPVIYQRSKINLNISLKSILTGIPLRAFEIMGSGGFLISNYQEDFLEFFTNEEDFVYYEDYEDLLAKAEYYLVHEKERLDIAQNGYEKVKRFHTYEQRVNQILEVVYGEK